MIGCFGVSFSGLTWQSQRVIPRMCRYLGVILNITPPITHHMRIHRTAPSECGLAILPILRLNHLAKLPEPALRPSTR